MHAVKGHAHDEFFRRHLQTIPTDRLADYPGIGPATAAPERRSVT